MLNKVLAAAGIGAARIDAVLDNDEVPVGGRVAGTVRVQGGSVAQDVEGLTVELITLVQRESGDHTRRVPMAITRGRIAERFTIKAGEARAVPFAFDLPLYCPITVGRGQAHSWLRTTADIPMARDPRDEDAVYVRPAPVQVDTVEAVQELGFRLYKTDVEYRPRWYGGHGFVQEFEFRPATRGQRHLDEVEIVFQPADGGYTLLVQVDRAARSLAGLLREATGTDETWHRLPLPNGLHGPGRPAIRDALARVLR